MDQFIVGVRPVRWWLSVNQAKAKYGKDPRAEATLVFRETASNTNERTWIAAVLPAWSAASHKLTGVVLKNVESGAALTVMNSLCFDYALRLRTAGTSVSFTNIQPMPVPPAEVVNRLPVVTTRLAWVAPIEHVTDDQTAWPALWELNKAVAEAYDLSAEDFAHILDAFSVMGRKRPEFMDFLRNCVAHWRGRTL